MPTLLHLPQLFRLLSLVLGPAITALTLVAHTPAGPTRAALEAANRADLRDTNQPMALGLWEAEFLASEAGAGLEVMVIIGTAVPEVPGRPVALLTCLAEDAEAEITNYALLYHRRRFTLLVEDPGAIQAGTAAYHEEVPPRLIGFVERNLGHVPARDSLIMAMDAIAPNPAANAGNPKKRRGFLAASMPTGMIVLALADMRADLIKHADNRPWRGDRFQSWGPRVSALLRADPVFMAERNQVLRRHGKRKRAQVAAPLASPLSLDELDDAQLASALSTGQETPQSRVAGHPVYPMAMVANGSQGALEAAYRADLGDARTAMFLDPVEGELLCQLMGMGITVYAPAAGPRTEGAGLPLRAWAHFNAPRIDPGSPYRLLLSNRHYTVLEQLPAATPGARPEADGHDVEQPGQQGFREVTERDAAGIPRPLIPADGNCLIHALGWIKAQRLPSLGEIQDLRTAVANRLSPDQVANALQELRDDLIGNAAFRPLEDGRFASWGPRVSRLLQEDPEFMADREEALEAQRALERQAAADGGRPAPMGPGAE